MRAGVFVRRGIGSGPIEDETLVNSAFCNLNMSIPSSLKIYSQHRITALVRACAGGSRDEAALLHRPPPSKPPRGDLYENLAGVPYPRLCPPSLKMPHV